MDFCWHVCTYLSQINLKDVRPFAHTETPLQIHVMYLGNEEIVASSRHAA